ncbi:MAG: biopolymer transporter ExbD [Bacteroidetes bacterium]|nr:biopolymer transporter ExbD [Bacteroidota bacterium]
MAARKLEEINAGSMADIAFLLLIFFLVTTTMEVDAGISRNLPLKRELDPNTPIPVIHDRDILVIMANSRDELLVEGEFMMIEDLEEKVRDFYLVNANGQENDIKMPAYKYITGGVIQEEMAKLKAAMDAAPENQKSFYQEDITKWEKRKTTFQTIGAYSEISNSALIQLKNQANTSYGLYIQVQDILKKVVNDLRNEKSEELGWGEYKKLDPDDPDDQEKIEMLQVLVPERIIEAKIEQ